MKKKVCLLVLFLSLFLGLPGCGASPSSPRETAVLPSPSLLPGVAPTQPVPPTPGVALSQDECVLQYRDFLSANYAELSAACYSGIAGLGFIDLDLDEQPELLLFDGGASASMGVQLFDLAKGKVTCVSASMEPVGKRFGGEYFSTTYVEANFFEDFRLMENSDGLRYFDVLSSNGAEDFWYVERIRFSQTDGVLTLRSLHYQWVSVDVKTGDPIYTSYSADGATVGEELFKAAETAAAAARDTGYSADGAFVWENKAFTQDRNGFLQLFDAAVAAYVPID